MSKVREILAEVEVELGWPTFCSTLEPEQIQALVRASSRWFLAYRGHRRIFEVQSLSGVTEYPCASVVDDPDGASPPVGMLPSDVDQIAYVIWGGRGVFSPPFGYGDSPFYGWWNNRNGWSGGISWNAANLLTSGTAELNNAWNEMRKVYGLSDGWRWIAEKRTLVVTRSSSGSPFLVGYKSNLPDFESMTTMDLQLYSMNLKGRANVLAGRLLRRWGNVIPGSTNDIQLDGNELVSEGEKMIEQSEAAAADLPTFVDVVVG